MLVAGKRVADQDGVRSIGVQPSIGLVADVDGAEAQAPIQLERAGERDGAGEAEALIKVGHGGDA
jgi:hypothetical protein